LELQKHSFLGGSILGMAKEKMVFEDLNITLKIFDITKGDSGNKPSFLQIKADIKLTKEINKKGQMARASNNRSLNPTTARDTNEFKTDCNGFNVPKLDVPNDFADDEADPIRVVFAGGDGTIMWGMMELGA
jgi:hypothetical protein